MPRFLEMEISGPLTIGSGVVARSVEDLKRITRIPEVGVITTKSIGLKPQNGYPEPNLVRISGSGSGEAGTWVNCVGLAGPGVDAFAAGLKNLSIPDDRFLLVSIFGDCPESFAEVASKLLDSEVARRINGFELNLSCPHAEGYGQAVCQDSQSAVAILKAVRRVCSDSVKIIPKLSPNLSDAVLYDMICRLSEEKADAITLINTVGPVKTSLLSRGSGGQSGSAIFTRALEIVKRARAITKIPIIGMGGVSCQDDASQMYKAGASIVGVGSALIGLDDQSMKTKLEDIALAQVQMPEKVSF